MYQHGTPWKRWFLLCTYVYPSVSYHLPNSLHTLPICSGFIRLSWLVCFTKVSFSNLVKSWLRQWGPWISTRLEAWVQNWPLRCLLDSLGVSGLWLEIVRLMATPNNPNSGYNLPLTSHPPPPPTPPPSHLPTPLYVPPVLLEWLWKKLLKIQQC